MLASVKLRGKGLEFHLKGKWMAPIPFILALKEAGLNIFPAVYSHFYVVINNKARMYLSKFNVVGTEDAAAVQLCQGKHQEPRFLSAKISSVVRGVCCPHRHCCALSSFSCRDHQPTQTRPHGCVLFCAAPGTWLMSSCVNLGLLENRACRWL